MQRIKCILVFAVFAIAQFSLFSQSNIAQQIKRCAIKTINFEQGLTYNEMNSIITDASGFMWVSTRAGMQRYNGYVLENINPVIGKDTIKINSPVFFWGMQNHCLWISYKKGVLSYNPATRSFQRLISVAASEKSFFPLLPLIETKDGVWCIQEGKGIVIYKNGNLFEQKKLNATIEDLDKVIRSKDVFFLLSLIAHNNNLIFLRITENQILEINTKTHQSGLFNCNVSNIIGVGCSENKLFITSTSDLYCFDISTSSLLKKIPFSAKIDEPLVSSCIEEMKNDKIIVSINSYLYEFDSTLSNQREYMSQENEHVIPTGSIHHIFIDQLNRIWLLTDNDIRVVRNTEIPFEHYVYRSEKSNYVRTIYYDKQKNYILAGCINVLGRATGGIRMFDTLSNPLWAKPFITDEINGINMIEKLCDNNYLVILLDQKGWYVLKLPEKKIFKCDMHVDAQTKAKLCASWWPNNLQRINDSSFLVASSFNIFQCTFKKTSLQSAIPLLPVEGSPSNHINCFVYSKEKILWAGTHEGLIYKFAENAQLQTIVMPGNYPVRCMSEDSLGHIWVGTDKGLFIFEPSGSLVKKFDNQSGLLNDFIYAILPVSKTASVFVSTKLGLSYVSETGTVKNYTKQLGLQENEFNTDAATLSPSGKFFFGGINGITAFRRDGLAIPKDTPILNIAHLSVNDVPQDFSTNLWRGDSIFLNYSQNHIQFDLAAMGLLNANEYGYTYRLKDFENLWQTTHQPTEIKYTLPPGKYLLEINFSPILSPESIFHKNIFIILYPPWWQTWWFRSIALLALIAIVSLIVWQYNRRKFAKKINELELQHEIQHERERISRDLHDNLGAYAAAIAVNVSRVKDDAHASKIMNELQNNSQAIVTQLNDTIWALNREAISLTAISDRFKIFLQKIQPSYQQIIFSVNETIAADVNLSPVNALHLFRIMQEAVNNAARHSNGSHINTNIESNSICSISITDDGGGIINEEKNNAGNGLKNMKLRASEAGWHIKWENQKPHGTKFVIMLKADGVL